MAGDLMVHFKLASVYVAIAAAIVSAFIPFLPDTAAGSPRALAMGAAAGLAAVAVILRGADVETHGPET